MDKLDIFEMPLDVKIITTIGELQRLYFSGYDDGTYDRLFSPEEDRPTLVRGDVV